VDDQEDLNVAVLQSLNYAWRLGATASAFTLFGIGGVILPVFASPLLFLLSRDQYKRRLLARRLVSFVFRSFVYYMRFVGILHWDYRDIERLREPQQLIIANHPTLLDVVFLVSLIPNACCIVKGPVFSNPAMRGLVSMAGYIVNTEGEGLLEAAGQALTEGASLVIFPEGTRTRQGQEMQIQRGWARIALSVNLSPTRVLIKCNPPTLSKQHKWYHIPDRRFLITVDVRERMPLGPYADLSPAQGARRMTNDLKTYYLGEL
jgi:1-acyl-sn-glycerol-3-phosphate acyltransferase